MSIYEIMELESPEEHNQWIRVEPVPKKEENNDGVSLEAHTFDAIDAVNSYFKEFIYPFEVLDDGFQFRFLIRRTEPGEGEEKCVFIFARAIVENSFQDQTDPILNVVTRGLNEEDSEYARKMYNSKSEKWHQGEWDTEGNPILPGEIYKYFWIYVDGGNFYPVPCLRGNAGNIIKTFTSILSMQNKKQPTLTSILSMKNKKQPEWFWSPCEPHPRIPNKEKMQEEE